MDDRELMAIDVGYSDTKAKYGNDNEISFPSILVPALNPFLNYGAGRPDKPNSVVSLDGHEWYYVGTKAVQEDRGTAIVIRSDDKLLRDDYSLLLGAALVGLRSLDSKVNLVLDLPLSQMTQQEVLRQRYQDSALEIHTCRGKVTYQIGKVWVVGQGVAALFAAVSPIDISRGTYAVIDIGGNTTDYTILREGAISQSSTHSLKIGVHQIMDYLVPMIGDKTGRAPRRSELAHLLRRYVLTGEFKLKPKRHEINLTQDLEKIVRDLVRVIVESLQIQIFDRVADIDGLVLAGGGAALLSRFMRAYTESIGYDEIPFVTPDEPYYANVRGAYLLATMLE